MIDALEKATRPLVTLALTAALIYGFLLDKVGAEAFLGIVGGVIGFWFSQRQLAKEAPKP